MVNQRDMSRPGLEGIDASDLPEMPLHASEALRILQDPSVSNHRFGELLDQTDNSSLASKLLFTANSPLYAGLRKIQTTTSALVRLGLKQFYRIVIVASLKDLYDTQDPQLRRLWDHSIATGMAGHILMEKSSATGSEEVFFAGLLHDIGKLVIRAKYMGFSEKTLHEPGRAVPPAGQARHAVTPLSHTEIGCLLADKWHLSEAVVEAIRFHHQVEKKIPFEVRYTNLVCTISLANAIVNNLGIGIPRFSWYELSSLACARWLNFHLRQVEPIFERLSEVFELDDPGFPPRAGGA